MSLTLRPTTRYPHILALSITRAGRKVGSVTMLSPTLWIAALDDPQVALRGSSLADVREQLRALSCGKV